ncbi:hypothetical protein ACIRPX_31670 [Streptomyces sp. NPDC101225]|uniref:hypothetical protein n=1 Tax=Streptomyces sp. NPDC101225 TaxID=3366135 RepID=UPI00380CB614
MPAAGSRTRGKRTLHVAAGATAARAAPARTGTEQDSTHVDPPGAVAVARLAPRDVVRLHDSIPPSWITWTEATGTPVA